jgi:uncharacterized protein YjbI with pentapeptide repeats
LYAREAQAVPFLVVLDNGMNVWTQVRQTVAFVMITVGVIIAILLLISLIQAGYRYTWTGFGASTPLLAPNQVLIPAKTFWDWLELLLIPMVLAVGGIWWSRAMRREQQALARERVAQEERLADAQAQAAALQAYLEQLSTLLIEKELRTSAPDAEVRRVASAWTQTIARRLRGESKGLLVSFLHESGLITGEQPILSLVNAHLEGARLSGFYLVGANFQGANLRSADLQGANLEGATCVRARLERANLESANLERALLMRAELQHATLNGAMLVAANLEGANLKEAHLLGSRLQGAYCRGANLEQAGLMGANLKGADLQRVLLMRANLWRANLSGANLQGAMLMGASLQGALLAGTNLQRALLMGTDLHGALYDAETQWPAGFDPEALGALRRTSPPLPDQE